MLDALGVRGVLDVPGAADAHGTLGDVLRVRAHGDDRFRGDDPHGDDHVPSVYHSSSSRSKRREGTQGGISSEKPFGIHWCLVDDKCTRMGYNVFQFDTLCKEKEWSNTRQITG